MVLISTRARKICLLAVLVFLLAILNATTFENIGSEWLSSDRSLSKTNSRRGIADAAAPEQRPPSSVVAFHASAINISISVSPKRVDPIGGLAVPLYGNVTCTWWIEGFPIMASILMSSINYYVNFTIASPSGTKLKEAVYYWPEGIGNETHPIVQVYPVPPGAEYGLYECKVELCSGSQPPYNERAENSDCFGVRVTPPDFNFDLFLTPLDPFGGVNATSLTTGQYDTIVQDVLNITVALTTGVPDYVSLTCKLLTPESDLTVELTTYTGQPTFNSIVRVTVSGHPLGSYILEVSVKMNLMIPSFMGGGQVITTNILRRRTYTMQIYSVPIFDFTPRSGSVGTVVTLSGYGLDGADVYLGDMLVLIGAQAQTSTEGEELFLHVHQNMPPGSYRIRVESQYGSATHQTEFVVVGPNEMAITGRIQYEDSDVSSSSIFKPARLCKITLRHGDDTVADGVTNDNGYFTIVINRPLTGQPLKIRINGLRTSDFDRGMNFAAKVCKDLDFCNEYVWFDSFELNVPEEGPLEFGALRVGNNRVLELKGYWIENTEGWCGSNAHDLSGGSEYLNIADSVLAARQYADGMRSDDDSIGKVAVEYPDDTFTTHYNPYFHHICVETDYGFNDGVIAHEYGHHLEFQISRISLPDPWEWAHSWCSDKYPAFAWFEGFPAYLGNIVVTHRNNITGYNDPLYVGLPRYGQFAMEAPNCGAISVSKESTVAALLWDLADNPSDPVFSSASWGESDFDNIDNMERIIFQVFDSDLHVIPPVLVDGSLYYPQPNLDIFADFLRSRAPSQELEALLAHYGV